MTAASGNWPRLREQLHAAQRGCKTFEDVLAQRDEIEAGWQQLGGAGGRGRLGTAGLLVHSQLQARLNGAQRRWIERAPTSPRGAAPAGRPRPTWPQRRLRSRQHRQTLAQVQAFLAEMAEQQARRDAIAGELRELTEAIAGLRHEMDRLKAEGQAVKETPDPAAKRLRRRCVPCATSR